MGHIMPWKKSNYSPNTEGADEAGFSSPSAGLDRGASWSRCLSLGGPDGSDGLL